MASPYLEVFRSPRIAAVMVLGFSSGLPLALTGSISASAVNPNALPTISSGTLQVGAGGTAGIATTAAGIT